MTARILSGTFAQVLAALYQAPRGVTVRQWITMNNIRAGGKQGG